MPHQCTKCGKIYPDGDYRILNGCECGNNKFLYIPKGRIAEDRKTSVVVDSPKKARSKDVEDIDRIDIEGIECVKIIAPGQYEINLENIFKQEGIVIALQEEGRYVIHLPSLLKKREKKKK